MSGGERRTASVTRRTKETDVRVEIDLDGAGEYQVSTGLAFFDQVEVADEEVPISPW